MRSPQVFGQHLVVSDIGGAAVVAPPGEVLEAGQRRAVTGGFQGMDDMLLEIPQAEMPRCQPEHAGAMGGLARQEGGAAG